MRVCRVELRGFLSERCYQTLRVHTVRVTSRLSSCTKMPSPPINQDEEYRLIGMAIKFAGICGKEIRIHGRNRETVDESTTTH